MGLGTRGQHVVIAVTINNAALIAALHQAAGDADEQRLGRPRARAEPLANQSMHWPATPSVGRL